MPASENTVLVVGATGLLGRTLCEVDVPGVCCIPAARTPGGLPGCRPLDITLPDQVDALIEAVQPRWVVNTAAVTHVDQCEGDPELAYRVHVAGTRNLVRACEKTGSGLITLSTNYVFDGTRGCYGETDAPRPLNAYGRTKLESEAYVLNARCPGVVVRTAVLYGYQPECRPNFVTWAAGALASGKTIRVVTDERANPTDVTELAVFLLRLCQKDFQGVVHFGGRDFLSRYDMVSRLCACLSLDFDRVIPVLSAELGQKARRPLQAGLKTDRAQSLCGLSLAPFDHNLKQLFAAIDDLALFS